MAPFYEYVAQKLGWTVDDALLLSMKEKNSTEIARLDAVVKGI
jgi:hypothetical protein